MKLAEWLGVAYQTAWHLCHRIRAMMAEDDPVLRGIIELDEIYAGAAPRKQAKPARDHGPDDRVPAPNTTGRVGPNAPWCWWRLNVVARSMHG